MFCIIHNTNKLIIAWKSPIICIIQSKCFTIRLCISPILLYFSHRRIILPDKFCHGIDNDIAFSFKVIGTAFVFFLRYFFNIHTKFNIYGRLIFYRNIFTSNQSPIFIKWFCKHQFITPFSKFNRCFLLCYLHALFTIHIQSCIFFITDNIYCGICKTYTTIYQH